MNELELRTISPIVGISATAEANMIYHERWAVLFGCMEWPASVEPAFDAVTVALRLGYMTLRAPGMLRLDVPLDVIEDDPSVIETLNIDGKTLNVVDEGAWAAAWFTEISGRPARLVKLLAAG